MHFPPFTVRVSCWGQQHTLAFKEDAMMPDPVDHPEGRDALLRVWHLSGEPKECGCAVVITNWRHILSARAGTYNTDSSSSWMRAHLARRLQLEDRAGLYLEPRLRAQTTLRSLRKELAYRGPSHKEVCEERMRRADQTRMVRWNTTVYRWRNRIGGGLQVKFTEEMGTSSFIADCRNLSDGGLRLTVNLRQWARFTRSQLALTENGDQLVVKYLGMRLVSSDTFAGDYLVIGRQWNEGFMLGKRSLIATTTKVDGVNSLATSWSMFTPICPVTNRNLEKKHA